MLDFVTGVDVDDRADWAAREHDGKAILRLAGFRRHGRRDVTRPRPKRQSWRGSDLESEWQDDQSEPNDGMNWRHHHPFDSRHGGPGARLLPVFAIWQLVLHVLLCLESGDPRLWMPHAVAYLHDLVLLTAWFAGAGLVCHLAPSRRRAACEYVAAAGLFGIGVALAGYPRFLREYLAFPLDLFAADAGSAGVLLRDYLGLGSLWPAAVAAGLGVTALAAPVQLPLPRRVHWGIYIPMLVLGGAALVCPSPQPFVYSVQQQVKLAFVRDKRVVPRLRRPPAGSEGDRGLPLPQIHGKDWRADHVLLIVLEGVTSDAFEREFLTRGSGFYARIQDRCLYFPRYYATNLDSYTSLIAMLTSVQVPYRAYADEGLYRAVNEAGSLPRSLRGLGFRTLYLCTCAHQPFVPTRNAWDRVMDRRDLPSLEGWLSVGSSRMEAATEDRAGLATVEEFVAGSPRSFVLQELVFGHSPEWRARTGQTQLAYYDAYLNDLFDRLEARGLVSRSLLVIVSDHGDRAGAGEVSNYRVPLLLVGEQVRSGRDPSFRSHLDLQALIISFVTGEPMPPSRARLFVVGSTARWVYGAIAETGGHLFLDDTTGRVLSQQGSLDPSEVHESFQAALDEFGRRFGR
jgi:hypothetical protein